MNITLRVNREDPQLVENLAAKGVEAKVVKGGTIVTPSSLDHNDGCRYSIPTEVVDATILINVEEFGGGMTKTGMATVVCGVTGQMLRPYQVPRSGHLSNATHAYFSVPSEVVTIEGENPNKEIVISRLTATRDGGEIRVVSQILWQGKLDYLPTLLGCFKAAAETAVYKAFCYHCREPHYADMSAMC